MSKAIMIVDDNEVVRQALCQIFTREGDFDVCGAAANGKEAVEKAQQLHPDAIVLDFSMPVMNGLETARILKESMPSVVLIMYTVFGDIVEQQARDVGISAVVSKSDQVSALICKIRNLLHPAAA
jgi:two-component system vancomycin resistance associated response regulator VraR